MARVSLKLQVLDMRDAEFEVSSVRESDVIHANKKDVSCIFRVTTSLMDPPGVRHQCLMLADSESEKTKWVVALNELHRDEDADKRTLRSLHISHHFESRSLSLFLSIYVHTWQSMSAQFIQIFGVVHCLGVKSVHLRILKKNKLPDKTVFRCREVLDNTVSIIKNAMSASLVDRDRIAVGTEDGLFCVDLDRDEICRIGDQKKIHQVRV